MPGVHSKSLAGTYPVRGLLHLLQHPRRLGVPVAISTAQACVVSLLALFPLFHFGYGWQTRLIGHFYKDWASRDGALGGLLLRLLHPSTAAALTSGLFCVAESFMVTSQVTHFFIGSLRERFFDATLEERHIVLPPAPKDEEKRPQAETVEEWVVDKLDIKALPTTREEMTEAAQWWLSGSHIMGLCAKKEAQVWPLAWLPTAIYVVSLPLTFVPVVGPASFLAMQGICQGGAAHRRYFDRFSWSNPRRIKHTTALYWHYLQFGMVASALEMIPFVGFVFAYTNQIGAAMLVADWKQERIM